MVRRDPPPPRNAVRSKKLEKNLVLAAKKNEKNLVLEEHLVSRENSNLVLEVQKNRKKPKKNSS